MLAGAYFVMLIAALLLVGALALAAVGRLLARPK
jgi:hypothetical protein